MLSLILNRCGWWKRQRETADLQSFEVVFFSPQNTNHSIIQLAGGLTTESWTSKDFKDLLWFVSPSEMPGGEGKAIFQGFSGEKCESRQTKGQKTLGWLTNSRDFFGCRSPTTPFCCPDDVTDSSHVGRQQPAATASLPAVFLHPPSPCGPSHPVSVPQPACHALQPAVQRQPGGPQPHKLTGLHPRSLLPASDRAHQGDGHPRSRRPLTVCCQGARLLHRGSEGTFCRLYFGFSILRLWDFLF